MNKLPSEIKDVITSSHLHDLTKAEKIASNYVPFMNNVTAQMQLLKVLKKGNKEDVAKAKRIKLDLGKICSSVTTQKKTDKDGVLLEGRFIDALFNTVNNAARITQGEAQEIEQYFEIQEKERLQKIQDKRIIELSKYVDDVSDRYLADMEEDVWVVYIASKKKDSELLIEAKKQAEIDRISKEKEEIAERKRIKEENEILKKQADEREKEAKILAIKDAEKRELEQKRHEAELLKERQKAAKIEGIEREKREKAENELREKQEVEQQKQREEEERAQSELNKGDKDKVVDLKLDLKSLKTKYSFKSKHNKKMYQDVCGLIDKVINHIEKIK